MLWVLIRIAHQGNPNEYPQHMFLCRTRDNYPLIIIKYPPYLFYICSTGEWSPCIHTHAHSLHDSVVSLCADEVAIIDEIQMLRDSSRGWAWTKALLGLNADEIHVCGEGSAVDIVQEMVDMCGDEMEVCSL